MIQIRSLAAILTLVFISASSPALARGTHFLLEAEGSAGITDGGSFATGFGGTLGYGGKFKGFPLRFYLVTSVLWDRVSGEFDGSITYADRTSRDLSLLAGPRLYIPLGRSLRLFFQFTTGVAWSQSVWNANDMEHYEPSDTSWVVRGSGGLQARLTPGLSLGLGVDRLLFWGKQNDPSVAAMLGFSDEVEEGDQVRLNFSVTFHF